MWAQASAFLEGGRAEDPGSEGFYEVVARKSLTPVSSLRSLVLIGYSLVLYYSASCVSRLQCSTVLVLGHMMVAVLGSILGTVVIEKLFLDYSFVPLQIHLGGPSSSSLKRTTPLGLASPALTGFCITSPPFPFSGLPSCTDSLLRSDGFGHCV
jgi:hypothetical protein